MGGGAWWFRGYVCMMRGVRGFLPGGVAGVDFVQIGVWEAE